MKYCSEQIATVMDLKSLPDTAELQSIQSILDTYTTTFYNNMAESGISQLDGNFDLEDAYEEVNNIYGVSCESNKLIVWINFLRGFENIWEVANEHSLCQRSCPVISAAHPIKF